MLFLEVFHKSLNKNNEELCGDRIEIIREDDFTIIVLADGLGSGVKANILATMTAKIVATLLKNHLSIEEAVKTIIKTLPVCKTRNLAYSTFTLVKIDKEGNAYIIEFDNPTSVIVRDGINLKVDYSEKIIEGQKIKEAKIKLKEGDELFLFSDGVVHAGIGGVLKLGWEWGNIVEYIEKMHGEHQLSVYEKVMQFISVCNLFYMEKPGDDSSIVGLKVLKESHGTIMIGPPIDRDKDQEVVNILIKNNNIKAVCGGTASKIISRITGHEVIANLEFPDPTVPPTGYIKGIDLVTEGVITLSKTHELLKKIINGTPNFLNYSKEKDGASKLLKLLLNDCTNVKFLVGLQVNPAHQEIGSKELMMKHKVVDELIEDLKRIGKKISIQYF